MPDKQSLCLNELTGQLDTGATRITPNTKMTNLFGEDWLEGLRRKYRDTSRYVWPAVDWYACHPKAKYEMVKLERIFKGLLKQKKKNIIGNFRSEKDRQHYGAYYELAL